jgi:hypothetical protein
MECLFFIGFSQPRRLRIELMVTRGRTLPDRLDGASQDSIIVTGKILRSGEEAKAAQAIL